MASPTATGISLDSGAGSAQSTVGISFSTLMASLATGLAAFGIQFLIFYLLKFRLRAIYAPKSTGLVPERERVAQPPSGLFAWLIPVFKTSNSEFIQKCGIDAYLFLRYLRMLLKIFLPLSVAIMPILIPINATGTATDTNGLDKLGWQNVGSDRTSFYWAHCMLAIFAVSYVCYVFYDELRRFIRLRQAYLTSPQHRIRASATTVLVTGIPRKWLTKEALDALYDVFPGGIRNIWVNRNYDELSDKVDQRDKVWTKLEQAETELIKKAIKAHREATAKADKAAGVGKTKQERADEAEAHNKEAEKMATGHQGLSSGNPHQIPQTLGEALGEENTRSLSSSSRSLSLGRDGEHRKPRIPIPVLGQGLDAISHGLSRAVGGVAEGFGKARKDFDTHLEALDPVSGYVTDYERRQSQVTQAAVKPRSNPDVLHRDKKESSEFGHGKVPMSSPPQSSRATAGNTLDETTEEHHGTSSSPNPEGWAGNTHLQDSLSPNEKVDEKAPANAVAKKGEATLAKNPRRFFSRKGRKHSDFPSPQPFVKEDDEFPLAQQSPKTPTTPRKSSVDEKGDETKSEYPQAYNEEYLEDDKDALWRKYLEPKDRETMRLPMLKYSWWPSLPLMGKEVDTIYHCRKELARLNSEIEVEQNEPEKFPLMSSAFIQFNNQAAAHMACQSVSHHLPKNMAPRVVEIDPKDVLWDNLSINWWERWARTTGVTALIVGLVIAWAIPVSFTSFVSRISYLAETYSWLQWLEDLPTWVKSLIQGVLPQALLAILLVVLPILLRFLAGQQGPPTGAMRELSTQNFYFSFLFIQVFLVVSIATGITATLQEALNNPVNIPSILAKNLPKASNYFFSYLLLQALTVSAGNLLQIATLLVRFLLARILDSTAREKFARTIKIPIYTWGSFFPIFTNLAVIGLVYSVITPLILVFCLISFALFWIVFRHQTLYVYKSGFDTGGLLFPKAVNQLFVGLYTMELALIGLFFLVRDSQDRLACTPQAITMIVVTALTVLYQYLLNDSFGPLFKYIPITMEDDAVLRDEEFERAQSKRWKLVEEEQEGDDLQDVLEKREEDERRENEAAEEIELQQIESKRHNHPNHLQAPVISNVVNKTRQTWAERSRNRRVKSVGTTDAKGVTVNRKRLPHHANTDGSPEKDLEAQAPIGSQLFEGVHDELEDLTADERDILVQDAFRHAAVRARRPCVWIPRDELGVSDDEIRRTNLFSGFIWISNQHAGLDYKARVVAPRAPPDFTEVDLIQL